MLVKFKNHIQQNLPFLLENKLLLAVSGGLDSMVLVNLCQKLNLTIAIAHCNFQLRGEESDEDEQFVKDFCIKNQIPFHITQFETDTYALQKKRSIQVVARNLRYDYFHSILVNNQYDYILTAHHLNDSLETFLINFTRGTGLEGLTGIPEKNDKIIRTLLPFSRLEIYQYGFKNKLIWREDSSNRTNKYQRNKYRHSVIPLLESENFNLLHSFKNTLNYLKQAQSMVNDASEIVYKYVVTKEETTKINIPKLIEFPNYKAYLYHWLAQFGFTAWDDIYALVYAQPGKQVTSQNFILLKDRSYLILYPKKTNLQSDCYLIEKDQLEVKFPLNLSLCNVDYISNVNPNVIFVDEEKIQFPLQIRKWKHADNFYPFGMNGSKLLSKYFKDEKLSLYDKTNTWLLCSDNKIIWIIGKRQDNRFRITEKTTRILQIKYTP